MSLFVSLCLSCGWKWLFSFVKYCWQNDEFKWSQYWCLCYLRSFCCQKEKAVVKISNMFEMFLFFFHFSPFLLLCFLSFCLCLSLLVVLFLCPLPLFSAVCLSASLSLPLSLSLSLSLSLFLSDSLSHCLCLSICFFCLSTSVCVSLSSLCLFNWCVYFFHNIYCRCLLYLI